MTQSHRFNYIITIHNKEDIIEQVLMCVLMCCRDNSYIYPVLDGCTDHTEEIVDRIIQTYANIPMTKVYTPDVHELLSINAGLQAADQKGEGFNIILQDDVLLGDFMWEKKVTALYQWAGPKLGYLSFRMGANFKRDTLKSTEAVPYENYIENVYGHGLAEAEPLFPGYFAYRTVPIKSPVCIPFELIRKVGMYEEKLAPYGHDDPEYAIRSINAGFDNAVFAMRFYSDIKWGGTRAKPHPQLERIIGDNMNRIRDWHCPSLERICADVQASKLIKVPEMVEEDEIRKANDIWKRNMTNLKNFEASQSKGLQKIRLKFNKILDRY